MPETKTLIPLYFLTQDNEIKCQYITPLALYKIYHHDESEDNLTFALWFMDEYNLSDKFIISYNLDKAEKRCNDENIKGYTILIQDEYINTIEPDDRSDLLTDNSKTLYRCIDIYGNIVEVFVPNNKINDKKYWIKQAQQYKLICDSYYLPFHYSSKDTKLKKVKEEIGKKIFRKTTACCFYDTEMEDEYYKCYGIKFPVEEKEGDLETIKNKPLKVVKNEFPKVKIYYEKEIEEELKSNYFFHETSFKIGDTEIDLTPSKEKMDELNSLPECNVDIAYSPDEENPKTKVIALIDSNKAKDRSVTTSNDFIAKITINGDESSKDYGKVMKVEFGIKNKEPEQKYEAAEARKLLLVNCAREDKKLSKTTEASFLDLVLSNPKYYTTEDCPVRLPNCSKLRIREWSREEIEKEVKSCTKNFSNNCNMIIPMFKESPDSTYHMFVIVATKKNDKISFKIFDPGTALGLENKNEIKQGFGDYIYNNLEEEEEKEKYILSPEESVQIALIKHNPIFGPTCTGISTEYINYIIDNGQDKNPQQLTEEEGKKIQERYAKHVVENGLHHIISGEQQIEPSILLYNNETLKLVKCSDYEKNPKNYGGYQVICTTNGQEFIITSDEDKFNNDIPEIKNGTDKNGEDKDNYVIFPVYVNNRKLYLSIYENGVTFLMDTKLQENRPVVLTDFDTSLLFNAASNSIPENSSNTPNDRILLYNNERLKLVKCSDYENKLKNDEKYHVVYTKDGEKFIIPSDQGKFNNNIPQITNGTVDKDNYATFPVLVNNKEFDLFIYEEGITFLKDKNSHKYYGPVDLTGFDTSPLFKTPSNSIPENSSNKSSETVAKSEETKKEVQQVVEESQTTTQAKNTLQEKITTVENKPQDKPSVEEKKTTVENKPQDKPSVEEKKNSVLKENKTIIEEKLQKQPVVKNEVVDKKEVKPEAVSVAVNNTDKKPIKEEVTVRNAPVETPKQYFIKTEFVDGKLKMTLIEYKAEEHKKDFVKFCNDNHILFTKKGDEYGCLFNEETANKIINDGKTINTAKNIYIYTNNEYINKNDYIKEQKKKEEEQKKKELSGISSLKDINKNINKNNQVEETSKGGFSWFNFFGKKSTNSEKKKLPNTSEEKKTSKGRW